MTQRFKRPTVPGETLACWRRRNEWLQTEAADLLGVSIRAYKSYEAGACPQVVWMAAQFYTMTHKKKQPKPKPDLIKPVGGRPWTI